MRTLRELPYYLGCILALTILSTSTTGHTQDTPPDNRPLQLVGTFPLEDGVFDTQIVFYFDQALAPVDDPSTLIQFDPPLEGSWSQGERHVALTLSPEIKRERGLYRATFLPALRSRGGTAPDSNQGLLFSNFQLQLASVDYGQIGVNTTQLALTFSGPVSWTQLQQHLLVTDAAGDPVRFSAPQRNAAKTHTLTVPTVTTSPYSITLSAGLTDATGSFQTNKSFERDLPETPPFKPVKILWRHESSEKDIVVITLPYTVDATAFLEHFQLFPDDSTRPLQLEPKHSNDELVLRYHFSRPMENYKKLRYTFSGTMPAIPALYAQSPLQGTLLPTRDALQINYHNWDARGNEPLRLALYFNGTVDPDDLLKHLEITPTISNLVAKTGESGSVDLYGDWKIRRNYKLRIRTGLTDTEDSLTLEKGLLWNAGQAPKRSGAGFAFETPYYFPRKSAAPLPIYVRNLKKVDAVLYELFPSNLVKALQQMEAGKSPSQFGYGLARKIAEHSFNIPSENGREHIPLDDFFPKDRKGIFGISLSPAYDYYNTKIIVWTDIGVLAHWQDDALLLYAHNLWDLSPIIGGKVTIYSSKHQVMGEVTTDEKGVARLANWDKELGRPTVAIVETEGDFTFLPLQQRNEDPVAFTHTMPRYEESEYDAFLYADRNLYRPGETIHLRWLVRDNDGNALSGAPLNLRLTDPQNGKHEYPRVLSTWGSGSVDIETPESWLTGAYRVDLSVPGSKTSITTQTIHLEEFVPNRLAAEVKTEAPFWLPGEEHQFTVHGDHLSGGAARDRKTGALIILEKKPWSPEKWTGYHFDNDAPFKNDVRDLGESKTDDAGNATYRFAWNPPSDLSFPLTATLLGEVMEAGGRSVSARTETTFFPTDAMVGLAISSAAAGDGVDVAVVAAHPDGRPAPVETVQVTLEKKQWRYYIRRYSSHNSANWNDNFVTLDTQTVSLSAGKGKVTLPVPKGYGNYRVTVKREGEAQFATQSFYSYRGQAHINDASRPSLIELTADKKSYNVGDTATVQITSPFDGDAVVVLQHKNLEKMVTVPVVGGVGTFSLPLGIEHVPNLWMEATVIHPVEPGEALTYPYESFGMINLPVHDPGKAVGLQFVDLPTVIRPKTTLPVTMQSTSAEGTPVATEITLALVDEGIHQIMDYKNPDPVAWFQRPRRPDYRRAHYYDQVAYDFTENPIGGGALLKKRLGDDANVDDNWIKPLALWSGVLETDATGVVTFSMEIPEFAGKVRLVAVATTGSEAGSVVANVTIRRPVVLQTTLPRFVAPGDTFEATALLQNKENKPAITHMTVTAAEPMFADPFDNTYNLPAGDEAVVPVPLHAGDVPGSGMIRWSVASTDGDNAPLDEFVLETPLKIQAPSIFQSRSEMVVIPPGAQQEFVNSEFWENDLLETTLRVTPNPMARLQEALAYVVGYPHGCAEQTTSRCLPLFLLGQSAAQTGADWDATYFRQFVQEGINHLFTMQTRSGGLGYWPGAEDPYAYGSIYAAHFLTLAKKDSAFQVPQANYDRLMGYLRNRIPLAPNEGARSLYSYAYTCYVRALAKDPTVMEDMTSLDTITIPTTARQWLALAMLTFTGNAQQTVAYLMSHPNEPDHQREQGHTLNSTVRNDAITLLTQSALNLEQSIIQPQAEKLIRYLENNRYSTQEAAFVITALATYLQKNTGDISKAQASIARNGAVDERTGNFQYKNAQKGPGSRYTVANGGPTPLYVYHTRAGILVNPDVAAAAQGITLERSFHDKQGTVGDDDLKQGETYLVAMDITCDEELENVILVNLLPGGLDIENPRLDGDTLAPWKKDDGIRPSYIDVRDDRLIAAFPQLKRGKNRYYFAVRTVTAGTFRYPSANAECMYDLQFNARTAGSTVTITR